MVCKWNLFDIFHQFYNDVEESIDSAKSAEITKTSQAKTQMGGAPIRSSHIHIHQLHCLNTAPIFDTMPTSASGLWPHSWTQVQPACKGVAAPELGALLVREHLTSKLTTWVFEVVNTLFTFVSDSPVWVSNTRGRGPLLTEGVCKLKFKYNSNHMCTIWVRDPFTLSSSSLQEEEEVQMQKTDWHIIA